nr:MAG TPA: hypothetical protein [Caudoviricetes sp.]
MYYPVLVSYLDRKKQIKNTTFKALSLATECKIKALLCFFLYTDSTKLLTLCQ